MKNKLDYKRLEEAASKLKALAHPMRVAIIELLDTNKEMSVTEIYQCLELEQAAASHHLNILKHRGVLKSTRKGKKSYYSIKPNSVLSIIECVAHCETK